MTAPASVPAQRVAPPAPQAGATHQSLVQFGAQLADAGFPRPMIDEILLMFQENAMNMAFQSTASLLQKVGQARAADRDHHLRALRNSIYAMPTTMGYVPRDKVLGLIAAMITTPEPVAHTTRQQ